MRCFPCSWGEEKDNGFWGNISSLNKYFLTFIGPSAKKAFTYAKDS